MMRSAHEWRRHAPEQVRTRVPADRRSFSPPLEPPTTLAVSPRTDGAGAPFRGHTSPPSSPQSGESLIRDTAGPLAVEQAAAPARIVDNGSVRTLGRTIPARDPDCICECVCVCVCKELDEGTAPAAPAGSTSLPALLSRPLSPREGTARNRVPGHALARCEKLAAIEAAVNADCHVQNSLCCARVLRLWQDLVSVDRGRLLPARRQPTSQAHG